MEVNDRNLLLACVIPGTLFVILGWCSFSILWAVNWRPWRVYSWIFSREWTDILRQPHLDVLCGTLSLSAWLIVISPVLLLILSGCWLTLVVGRAIIGLAIIMAGNAFLLVFYAVMLWWKTQWQRSRAVTILLVLAIILLYSYELCALYLTTTSNASEQSSPSEYFFGVSAIALAVNMLFICLMVFNGNGFDLDEYVRKAYTFAYTDHVDTGPITSLREPPDPNELYPPQSARVSYLLFLYMGSFFVLVAYSLLYRVTAKEANWVATITSAAVIILDLNMGACLYGFCLLKNRFLVLLVAGVSRLLLISFGVDYWYLGHCVSYSIVSSVLLNASVSSHMPISDTFAARRDVLRNTVTRLREGFWKKDVASSCNSSDGCASSMKRSSSVDMSQVGNIIEMNSKFIGHFKGNVGGTSYRLVDISPERISVDKTSVYGKPNLLFNSCSTVQDLSLANTFVVSPSALDGKISEPFAGSFLQRVPNLDLNHLFPDLLNDSRLSSVFQTSVSMNDRELNGLLKDKGLDPNLLQMFKQNGLDLSTGFLLRHNCFDADNCIQIIDSDIKTPLPNKTTFPEELRLNGFEKSAQWLRGVITVVTSSPERAWVLLSSIFIAETVTVGIFHHKVVELSNTTTLHQFEFGCAVLLLSPVVCSVLAFLRSLKAEEMTMAPRPSKFGFIAWLLSTSIGLLLSFRSKSTILLSLSATVPLMVACFVVAVPIWIQNGYRFWISPSKSLFLSVNNASVMKKAFILFLCTAVFAGSIFAMGITVAINPLDCLSHKKWVPGLENHNTPFESSAFVGLAMASAVSLIVTGALPLISWFSTYRFFMSSALCLGMFAAVLVAFSSASYLNAVRFRDDEIPSKGDFLGALFPLLSVPALLSLTCGLYKWRDDDWVLTRGAHLFVVIGLVLLLGAISAVIILVDPWMIGGALLLVFLFAVLAIAVICYWASNNFFLTKMQVFIISFFVLVLAMAAFIVGWFGGMPFIGASVGYFSILFFLAGRALTAFLSPPVVIYSARVLPVYVYDSHSDCAKNVSDAFLMLGGIAIAIEGWGVVASLIMHPPFAGAAVSAITLVVAFGFAVSRPCRTLEVVEDAIYFLSRETIVQAISRSGTKARNASSVAYSASPGSSRSIDFAGGDIAVMRDSACKFSLPREDVQKLRDRLKMEEMGTRSFFSCGRGRSFKDESAGNLAYKKEMSAHARVLLLEEAIDTEWLYMWDKFGGYLLLLLALIATSERIQDEVRLRLFLDSIGLSNLNAKKVRSWTPEERRQFDIMQESYLKEKEMEDGVLIQRREEEERGKERRKFLLEKEERKWKELEASLLLNIPNAGQKDAAAVAGAVRAIGCDSSELDNHRRERIISIALRIRSAQLARRALQTGIPGAVCLVDDEPTSSGRHILNIDRSLCLSPRVSFSISVLLQPDSGPAFLFCSESEAVCLEILVFGSEQGIEAGQVGLKFIDRGSRQTTVAKEWCIGSTNVADGRWHTVTMTIDSSIGEVTCYLDGNFDGYQTGLQFNEAKNVWEVGTQIWIGDRSRVDVNHYGRCTHTGYSFRMHMMDAFLWGSCLSEDDIFALYRDVKPAEDCMNGVKENYWEWSNSPPTINGWDAADPAGTDNSCDSERRSNSGTLRNSTGDRVATDVIGTFSCLIRRKVQESQAEINDRMLSVEMAVRETLSANGLQCFTDHEFPPSDQSLFLNPQSPPSELQVVAKWMRPVEIVRESNQDCHPCLFVGSAKSSDVCQGRLGDCWFLSAVAVLSEASRISEVIITPEYNEEGIYTVRFCIQGEWVAVVVDDWIPCELAGKPAFASSKKVNEIWVSILEKAYAKLHGSYEALEGGLVQDALVDLTGGAGEEIDMRSTQAQIDLASGRLWSQLLRFKRDGFLLGAGSPSGSDVHVSSSGIVQGHAYSVMQVREVDGHKLVQVRDPWATQVEWNGPWCDSSSQWTERIKHKLKFVPQSKDGIFWMSWSDFQIHFRSIYVCRVYPPEMRYSVHGQWRGSTAGGCQDYDTWCENPQFQLRFTDHDASSPSIHLFITLTQGSPWRSGTGSLMEYRSSRDSTMLYIGMRILKTRGRRAADNIYMHEAVGGTEYVNSREISCEMVLEGDPTGYTIVPTTIHPGEEAPFVLSVFAKASVILEPF